MSKINDGGQAFPTHPILYSSADACQAQGMSLRDWFAGQAIIGFVQSDMSDEEFIVSPALLARTAYSLADAMIAERDRITSPAGGTIRSAQDEAMEASPVTAQPAVGEVSPSASGRPRMRRAEVPAYLMKKYGIPIALKTLNKLASFGGGPAIQYAGRIPLYRPEDLDAWAEQRLSAPVTSTAGRHNRG